MKRKFTFIVIGSLSLQLVFGQLTFSEKRQRDRALNEAITLIVQEEYELAASKLTRSLALELAPEGIRLNAVAP